MQNSQVLAPGSIDQLRPSSLHGAISMHRTNLGGRPISDHKLNMGFTLVQAPKKMYTQWRNCLKDLMLARRFAPAGRMAKDFPDTDCLPIYIGMRTLRPACDLIVPRVAANDMHRLEEMEEAVVELVKDSCGKLNDTNNKGKMVVPNPGIAPGQVVVDSSLLLPGAPNQWGGCDDYRDPRSTCSKSSPSPRPCQWTTRTGSSGCGWSNRTCCTNQHPCLGNSDRLFGVRLVQAYLLHKSTSLLPDHADRLLRVRLVQTYRLHRPTSVLLDNSDRLHRVRLVPTY